MCTFATSMCKGGSDTINTSTQGSCAGHGVIEFKSMRMQPKTVRCKKRMLDKLVNAHGYMAPRALAIQMKLGELSKRNTLTSCQVLVEGFLGRISIG